MTAIADTQETALPPAPPSGYVFGTDQDGAPASIDPSWHTGLLVTGRTGLGKTMLLRTLAEEGLRLGHEVCIAEMAKSGGEYRGLGVAVADLATSQEAVTQLLEGLLEEVGRRNELMADRGIAFLDEMTKDERPPQLLVLVDEFRDGGRIEELAWQLAGVGGAAGVFPVLSTQSEADLGDSVLSKLSFRQHLTGPGHGIFDVEPGESMLATVRMPVPDLPA